MMHIASSPDAAAFLLRMPWGDSIESLNLGRPGREISPDCVVALPFGSSELLVYPVREADIPAELPVFASPKPIPSSTLRRDYDSELTAIISRLSEMAERNEEGKVVAARVISAPPRGRRADIYNRLERLYPSAFVFYLSTPEVGSWMGASPELLLSRRGDSIRTMALAGTRPAGTSGEWDEKNRREQAMVTEFICETLRSHGLSPETEPPTTRIAGPVEHIVTEIKADVPDGFTFALLSDLIRDLSPTPALAGLPRRLAMDMIKHHETFSRHLYGGCIGRVKSETDWCFFVNLRSALLTTRSTFIYVGGGITALSEPVKEWEETELKAVTMLKAFAPESIRIPGTPLKPIVIVKRHRRKRPKKF